VYTRHPRSFEHGAVEISRANAKAVLSVGSWVENEVLPTETGHEIGRPDSLAKSRGSPEPVLSRMTKKASPKKRVARTKPAATTAPALAAPRAERAIAEGGDTRFTEVIALIEAARGRAYQAVNAELVSLYWQLGDYISRKIASAE
jgi:hypothetical protein